MTYSEHQITELARNNPKELARILTRPNHDVHMLAFGIETMGAEVKDEEIVLPVIKQLLKHVNAVVREGAVNGAFSFWLDKRLPSDIMLRLTAISEHDPSPDLREFAKSVINDWNQKWQEIEV